jgi:acyl-CoA synthetase (AMP-forming)/AMP-acid ligase II
MSHKPSRGSTFIGGDRIVSWSDLENGTLAGAHALAQAGLRPFDLVGICLSRSVDAAMATLSLLRGGFIGMAFDRRLTPLESQKIGRSFPFRAILTHASAAHAFRHWGENVKTAEIKCWTSGDLVLLLFPRSMPAELAEKNVRWTLLTSGSTGTPKAVMISGENLEARTKGEIELFGLRTGDKILNCLNFSHDLGFNQLLTSVSCGATLHMIPSLSPAELVRQLNAIEFTGMTATPTVWRNLLRAIDEGARLQSEVPPRYLTVSGGSLTDTELFRLRSLFPRTEWIRTYGQTETFRSLANKTSSPGLRPIVDGVRVRLFNDEGRECAPGETGELFHEGCGAMSGYLLDPEMTERKKQKHGLASGDYFTQDAQGHFHFVGRRDDMIKRDDHRLFLSEIETAVLEMEAVADAAVLMMNQRLTAYVVLKPGPRLSSLELRALCRERLTAYKVPDEFYVVAELPLTASGKIDRAALISRATEGRHEITS